MLLAKAAPRMTSRSFSACSLRNIATCPAELPPTARVWRKTKPKRYDGIAKPLSKITRSLNIDSEMPINMALVLPKIIWQLAGG